MVDVNNVNLSYTNDWRLFMNKNIIHQSKLIIIWFQCFPLVTIDMYYLPQRFNMTLNVFVIMLRVLSHLWQENILEIFCHCGQSNLFNLTRNYIYQLSNGSHTSFQPHLFEIYLYLMFMTSGNCRQLFEMLP